MNGAILTLALIGALSLVLIGTIDAHAAVDMFMKIDGVDGEALNPQPPGEPGWIQLDSMQWGIGSTSSGSSASRESSAPSISEVTVTKSMDSTSTTLMQEACCGDSKNIEIHFIFTDDAGEARFYTIILENARITSYSMDAEETASESLSLNYEKIKWEYAGIDPGGNNDETFEISKKRGHR